MSEPWERSATEAVRQITTGELTAEALMRSCLDRVEERDDAVRAWQHLDQAAALDAARAVDAAGPSGPLAGLPVAVKDIMDTSDMPTTYGSRIYPDHQPDADANCVARTRAAGAVVMGKTVTTEFAWRNPGPTRNPHNPDHTPGGSSSGSAAAVSDGQAMLAFGTQTAGSVIRPAAYCGAVGFKPSRGTHDTSGVKELSGYFDTVGEFARSVADVALFDFALRGEDAPDLSIYDGAAPRLAVIEALPSECTVEGLVALEEIRRSAEAAGAKSHSLDVNEDLARLADLHNVVMTAESARALAWEYDNHPELLIRFYREGIMVGRSIGDAELNEAKAEIDEIRNKAASWFIGFDAILTQPAPGEAIKGIEATGDPIFNKTWTALGWPCVTIPGGRGPNGLPLGGQIVGPMDKDGNTLAVAHWIETALAAK